MPIDDDWLFSRSGPRTARGGIKSQSNRGAFGKSWWARRWLQVLERFDIGTRLQRARSYARKGQVLSVDIQEGLVKATVQGSRKVPYDVEIRVKTISDEKWLELSKEAFNQAIVAAKLLAGEMPEDVEKLFAAHDVSLFPTEKSDLETECSCPDWSNPCKHIAAVYYLLGEEFDRDPFLIFRLRGMTKEKLLELVAGAPATKSQRSLNEISQETGNSASEPLVTDISSFWSMVVASEDIVGAVKAPITNASLPKRLGNLPFWRGKQSMLPLLEEIYKRASQESISILAEKTASLVFVLLILLCTNCESRAQEVADIRLFKRGGDEVDWCRSTGRIAYASRGPDNKYGIHTCLASGEDDVWITNDNPRVPPGNKGTPRWHPSGQWILFVAEKPKHPGSSFEATPGLGSYTDLWIMTADGQQAWQLTDLPLSGPHGIIIPAFSHDGTKIVWADRVAPARLLVPRQFCAYWDLKVADFVDVNGVPRLTNIRTIRPGGKEAFNESYGFTPDDRSIIFCSDFNQSSFFNSQIFTCDADTGGNIIQLTNGNYNEHACYSPDGKFIVWMTTAGEWRGTDWWIMNSDGSGKRQLTFFNKRGHKEYSDKRLTCGLGSFSPDGKQFLGGVQNSLIKQTGDSYMLTFR